MSETPVFTDYSAPEGLRTRGAVLVVPGRGESHPTYQRFGRRLAADAYRVRVVPAPSIDPADLDGSLDRLAAQLAEAAAGLGADGPTRPVVLVGSDLGAAAVAALLARPAAPASAWWPRGAVLAGLPGPGAPPVGDWDDELNVRSHCPAHRGVLDAGPRGTLATAVPDALLDAAYGSASDVPQLLLVGDDDPLADRGALTRAAKSLPVARLSVVRGAHHDVLNDLQHRSVAAEVITFLETLRDEPALEPIVTVESSAW